MAGCFAVRIESGMKNSKNRGFRTATISENMQGRYREDTYSVTTLYRRFCRLYLLPEPYRQGTCRSRPVECPLVADTVYQEKRGKRGCHRRRHPVCCNQGDRCVRFPGLRYNLAPDGFKGPAVGRTDRFTGFFQGHPGTETPAQATPGRGDSAVPGFW